MGNLVIIMGKSLAGKTYMLEQIKKEYPNDILITNTTRPIRPYEHNNIDYHFVDNAQFENDKKHHKALAIRSYVVASGETWNYYINLENLKKQIKTSKNKTVFCVLDLIGYLDIQKELTNSDIKISGIYLNTSLATRLKRYLNTQRSVDNEKEFVRRLYDDEFNAFENIDNINFQKQNHITTLNENSKIDLNKLF